MTRIQGVGSGYDVGSLQGLSALEQAQLVMLAGDRNVPNMQDLMQRLGMFNDVVTVTNGFDRHMAANARQNNIYTAYSGGAMQVGHKGAAVADLQRQLNALGANLEVDGYFGPKTEAALRAFQHGHGGIAHGVAGPETLRQLGADPSRLDRDSWARFSPNYGGPISANPQDPRRTETNGTDAANGTDGTTGPNGPARTSNLDVTPGIRNLLDEIAEGEGTSDATARQRGYNSGYDVTLGYGAYADDKSKPLTSMTLGEVKALQRRMLNNPSNRFNSSAAGRYQIVGTTLRGLQREMGLSDDEVFTPELQDRMALQLLERRGLSRFQSGRLSLSGFQNNLAYEWASIGRADTGRSAYGQGTGTSSAEIRAVLNALT